MSDETDAPQGGTEAEAIAETSTVETTPEATTGQPEAEADDSATADDAGAEPKPKQVPWFQKRIDEITAKRYEAERDAAYWRGIAEASGQKQPAPVEQGPPREDQYQSWDDYEAARIEYLVEQKIAAKEAGRQRETVLNTYGERAARLKESKPDFDLVVNNPSLTITPAMAEVIMESDVGPEVAYHLGTNPSEASRIAALPRHRQAAELGKLEARLTTPPPAPQTRTPPPPPPQTVGGVSAGLTKTFEEMSFAEFKKMRDEEEKNNR